MLEVESGKVLEVESGTALEVESGKATDWQTGRWLPKETVQTSHSPGEQLAIINLIML